MSRRKTIDARGAYCPGPLMELIAALKLVEIGDEIEVLSSDTEIEASAFLNDSDFHSALADSSMGEIPPEPSVVRCF